MRCNNCGYENASGTHCAKCNYPLKGSINEAGHENNGGEINPGKTIPGADPQAIPWDCPQCGYPMMQGSEICPKCGYNVNNKNSDQAKSKEEHVDEPVLRRRGNLGGTIDPNNMGFLLQPVATKFDKDMKELSFRFHAPEATLGREDLEPDNMTISGNHAEFMFHKGKWFIKDISSSKATYVQANDYMELSDGDVILMGDRKFIFKT